MRANARRLVLQYCLLLSCRACTIGGRDAQLAVILLAEPP